MQHGVSRHRPAQRGFTLLELMIVVAIVALATSAVTLALRDGDQVALERETLRLSALLESARAQSRTSGVPVYWRNAGDGFEFIGLPSPAPGPSDSNSGRRPWLNTQTRALIAQPAGAVVLQLGPEPLIAAQQVVLMQGDRRVTLGTDGLSPFAVVAAEGSTP